MTHVWKVVWKVVLPGFTNEDVLVELQEEMIDGAR
jgi:hypothetical protein